MAIYLIGYLRQNISRRSTVNQLQHQGNPCRYRYLLPNINMPTNAIYFYFNFSLVTGTVALVFSAIGILLSGFLVTRYKPSARYMAAWNIIVGVGTVFGMITYIFLGCADNEKSVVLDYPLG